MRCECVDEPTDEQIDAAAKAWLEWQFPGRKWDRASEQMKNAFRDGARRAIIAASRIAVPRRSALAR